MILFYVVVALAASASLGASPGSFNCYRSGQDCTNGGTCPNGVCDCGNYKHYDCSVTDATDGSPCTPSSCNGHGLCVGNGTAVTCHCEAGWEHDADGNCTLPRYKVYCSHNSMIINVNPHGSFSGTVYEIGDKQTTCMMTKAFDDADVVAAITGLPGQSSNPLKGGVVAVVYNNGTLDGTDNACSTVALTSFDDGDTTTDMYTIQRTFIVQYHPDYMIKADEKLVAKCKTDLKNQHTQITMGSITNNPATQEQVNAVTVTDTFGSTLALVNTDGSDSTTDGAVGDQKCLRLHNPSMSVHIKKVVLTNNLPETDSMYREVALLENSCKATSSGKLGSIWQGVPTLDTNSNVVTFCFGLFTIKPTSQLTIKVWSNLCPNGISGCEAVDCSGTQSNGRRKRGIESGTMQYSQLEIRGIDVYGKGSADTQKEQTPTSTDCVIDDRMFATVIALAVVVLLLLILLAFMVVRAFTSSARQRSNWREDEFSNPSYYDSQSIGSKR
ncbi:uncharacterized protein LOC121385249 [Gigantopelta aegis]|uniref:uncharacterized protein LOC121385249 n=1 Tax=Gigantopelta aegis TaxID=1735272 RepID=UPI001B88B561|nr:uncharacterized protein LOC121385249 [Gigantopelta aegis]XP_041371783.1 uncharacterized protein LOC121385249 [Gigantopelta aegis]